MSSDIQHEVLRIKKKIEITFKNFNLINLHVFDCLIKARNTDVLKIKQKDIYYSEKWNHECIYLHVLYCISDA
jgi:hypothetical protein